MNSIFLKFSPLFHCDYGRITNGYKTVTKSVKKLLKNDNIEKSGYNSVIYLDFFLRWWYNIARKRKVNKNSSLNFMIETSSSNFQSPRFLPGTLDLWGIFRLLRIITFRRCKDSVKNIHSIASACGRKCPENAAVIAFADSPANFLRSLLASRNFQKPLEFLSRIWYYLVTEKTRNSYFTERMRRKLRSAHGNGWAMGCHGN